MVTKSDQIWGLGQKENPAFNTNVSAPYVAKNKVAMPKVLIPVFPGTNCEYDTAKAMERAGAKADVMVIKNLTSAGITESVEEFASKIKESQIIFIPGGIFQHRLRSPYTIKTIFIQ